MCENCFIYNPEDQPVHKLGKELKAYFDSRWSRMPEEPIETSESLSNSNILSGIKEERKESVTSPINATLSKPSPISPSLTSNLKDIDDDDKIELILLDVQTEQSRIQQILSKLQEYGKELLELK